MERAAVQTKDAPAPVLRRLNMDTSWHITWGQTSLIVDPWRIGSEVDGASSFNEQWHVTAPVLPQDVPSAHGIVVSQAYADHCHDETLDAFSPDLPILAVSRAQAHLRKRYPKRTIVTVAEDPKAPTEQADLHILAVRPDRRLDPTDSHHHRHRL